MLPPVAGRYASFKVIFVAGCLHGNEDCRLAIQVTPWTWETHCCDDDDDGDDDGDNTHNLSALSSDAKCKSKRGSF